MTDIKTEALVVVGADSEALDILEGKEVEVVAEVVDVVEEVEGNPAKLTITEDYRNDIEKTPDLLRVVLDNTRYVEPEESEIILDLISLPSVGIMGIQEAGNRIDGYSEEEIASLGLDKTKATESIANAFMNLEKSGVDEEALETEGSDWRQDIDGHKTRTTEIKVKDRELTGDAALFSAMSSLGLGVPLDAILPHSGFWVRLTPPTDSDIISFRRRIARSKTELGRKTSGLTFSNQSAVINKELYNFIRRHISESSVSNFTLAELHKRIKAEDMRILAWQFARTFFTEGFLFAHDCMHFDLGCENREEVLANIDKLMEFDYSKLTARQREIIGITLPTPMTEELYIEYHNEWSWNKDVVLDYGEIKFTLQSPTLEDHFEDGADWVNTVSTTVNQALIEGDFEENSNEHLRRIDQYLIATNMRSYSHYVKQIEVKNGIRYTKRADIRNVMGVVSSRNDLVEKFEVDLANFRRSLMVAVIGIPEYECPTCRENNTIGDVLAVKKVIPLDVMSVFFLMLTTKYQMSTI